MTEPLRKCIGCGEMKEKSSLLRVVKSKDGSIFISDLRKDNGRSAYLCKSKECFDAAVKRKAIERSFKHKISDEIYRELEKEVEKYE